MDKLGIEQRDKAALRQGYSRAVRRFEIVSIAIYSVAMACLAIHIAPHVLRSPWLAASAFMAGFVAADFVSGCVHWAADTWGTPDWPVVGNALIRPFREHHVDQTEITRHDFIETNGNNCFISIFPTVGAALLPMGGAASIFCVEMVFALSLAILGTNQFHKWAHMESPPPVVRALQRANLLLPPEHHAVHHAPPYAKYYCITVGWLNEALYRLRFFQTLERVITATTGMLPREDDIGVNAARIVSAEAQAETLIPDPSPSVFVKPD
jgi:ubiquitin-conjugating enzyme E2 variant